MSRLPLLLLTIFFVNNSSASPRDYSVSDHRSDYSMCTRSTELEVQFFIADIKREFMGGDSESIESNFSQDYRESQTNNQLLQLKNTLASVLGSDKVSLLFLSSHTFSIRTIEVEDRHAEIELSILLNGLGASFDSMEYEERFILAKNDFWQIVQTKRLGDFLNEFYEIAINIDDAIYDTLFASLDRSSFPANYHTDSLLIPKLLFDYSNNDYDVPRMSLLASDQIWGYQAFISPVGISAHIARGFLGNHDFLFSTDRDAHRIVYTDNYISSIGDKFVASFGGYGNGSTNFNEPVGIDHWGPSSVLVADSYNHRVLKLTYNENNGDIYYSTEYTGYFKPVDVASLLLEEGPSYFAVADYGRNDIRGPWGSIGSWGSDSSQFDGPTSLAFWRSSVDGTQGQGLYVTDRWNNRLVYVQGMLGGESHFYYYTEFPPSSDLSSVDVDNKGSIYVVDQANCQVHKLTYHAGSFELIATWGSEGSDDFQINRPVFIAVAHGFEQIGQYPNHEFVPLISGDVFMSERWGDSTGIRRYEFGIDILDFKSRYYQPPFYPDDNDCLQYKIWLTDYAYIKQIIYYDNNVIDSVEHGIWAPGWWEGEYWAFWSDEDTLSVGDYIIEITATSIYDSSHQVIRANTVNKPEVYMPPIIIEGPIFIDVYSPYWFEDCLLKDMLYKACVTAEDQNEDGWIESYFWESNCGYFSDPWKNDSKEFVQYYTTEPFVHFTPTGGGKIGDMVFRIKVIDNHSFESEEIEIPLHIYENPDSCSGIPYICGDVNDDQSANVSDAVRIINFIFSGGAPPYPFIAGDVNCDYKVNISDAVWLINYVFAGGYAPCDTDGDGNPDCHDYL